MSTVINESIIESATLAWLETIGWQITSSVDSAQINSSIAERASFHDVVLVRSLRDTLGRLNPELSVDALEDAFRGLTRVEGSTLEARNREFHRLLVDGVPVEYKIGEDRIHSTRARVIDFDNPSANQFLGSQPVHRSGEQQPSPTGHRSVRERLAARYHRVEEPGRRGCHDLGRRSIQLQTYKLELPTLFSFNELLIASDGLQARMGTLTAGREWFKPWRTITGEGLDDTGAFELEVMLRGVCAPDNLLSLIRNFIVFETTGAHWRRRWQAITSSMRCVLRLRRH